MAKRDIQSFLAAKRNKGMKEVPEDAVQQAMAQAEALQGQSEEALFAQLLEARQRGEVTDAALQQFAATVAPMLDEGGRQRLQTILSQLR